MKRHSHEVGWSNSERLLFCPGKYDVHVSESQVKRPQKTNPPPSILHVTQAQVLSGSHVAANYPPHLQSPVYLSLSAYHTTPISPRVCCQNVTRSSCVDQVCF
ncbi:hypothetical protein Q8A73_009355 [Channa argus]|nr:hypothetical protein Q8A73_009355 [Channa argus]